jgi:uncharacterized protein YbjT (DUF2867 family)
METENAREMETGAPGTKATTLVLGGTGKTGRRVVERLEARGIPVRVGSRSAEPPFDWDDEATWAPALSGVGSVYVTYYPDLAVPGSVEAVRSFADLAVKAGVRRLVLLSGRGEPEAERAELALQEVVDASAGAEWTILRSTWFMQNFSEDYMLEHVLSGEIRLPAGDVPTPFLDADDIADVAVAALTGEGHAGRLYELTGPRSLTFAQAAAEIAGATGREIRYVPVSLEEHAAEAAEHGVPLAASPGTSPTTRAKPPPPPVSGTADDERGSLRRDAGDRPRMRLERGGLLRLLDVRYARAEAVAAGAGHSRDAIDQQAGRHPSLHGGAVRDGRGLPRVGRVGRVFLGRATRGVGDRRLCPVPRRHHRGDDRVQRPAQR